MKKLFYFLMMPLLVAGIASCNQDPKPQETWEPVNVAQFLAAEDEAYTQIYELEGTIGGTIDTTFGNFDLTEVNVIGRKNIEVMTAHVGDKLPVPHVDRTELGRDHHRRRRCGEQTVLP